MAVQIRLVGRETALAAARTALDDALAGTGRLLLVGGEPGIGKSALLAEVARSAEDAGARVLRGTCWEGAGAPAYWPWVQVLRGAGELGEAGRLLPESGPAAGSAAPAEARFRLFDAVTTELAGLAAATPLVVMLDDLQWADEPSLRLLEFAVRQLCAHRVLLLGAYRDAEAGDALRTVAGVGELLPLGGLARAEVSALVASIAGTELADGVHEAVWRRAGGNPFFVRELTRLLLAQGAQPAAGHRAAIPDSVWDTLERRLARLSGDCVRLLEIAAVAGPELRPELAARLLPPDPERASLAELLDEAVQARVLVPPNEPVDRFRFGHDLFRETLLAGLPPTARGELHTRVGRALADLRASGADVHLAELAAQFVAAGTADVAAEAVRYSAGAAEAATDRLAYEDAWLHYERALAALDRMPAWAPGVRLELLLGRADARNRAGDGEGARADYQRAAELARRAGDAVGLARAAVGRHGLGTRSALAHAESVALLREAAAALPAEPSALRARVLTGLVRSMRHSGADPDQDEIVSAGEDAVRVARAAGDPTALGFALLALHDALWQPGTGRQRLAVLEDMTTASVAAGERDLLAQARQLRAAALIELGDPAGRAELGGYIHAAGQLGHARGRWEAMTRQATLAAMNGQGAEAARLADEALAFGVEIGEEDASGVHGTLRASLLLSGAGEGFAPAGAELDQSAPPPAMRTLLRASLFVTAGDLEAARRLLAGFNTEELGRGYGYDLEWLAAAALVLASAGSAAQCAVAYERIRPFAGLHAIVGGCASYWGAVDHHLGLLARALGRREQAIEHLGAALAGYRRLGAPIWEQLCQDALDGIRGSAAAADRNDFRLDGGVWLLGYGGRQAYLPDAKGLRDIATLLSAPGEPVHAFTLLGRPTPATGSDLVLDEHARAAYKARLVELESEIDEAASWQDGGRAERARSEREALIAELTSATGLAGRTRRLGDEGERARKTVTARIRDALGRIERVHPPLGEHLRASISTGTTCSYQPEAPTRWRL